MATSTVIYRGDLRTEALHIASQNAILTDAPTDNHGKGEAFSPTDLVATALGSCMLTIMGIIAARENLDIVGTTTTITKIMADNPRRIGEIRIQMQFPPAAASFSPADRQRLENAARTCPVAQSLDPEIKQIIDFQYP